MHSYRKSILILCHILLYYLHESAAQHSCNPIYVRWSRAALGRTAKVSGAYSLDDCQRACNNNYHPSNKNYQILCAGFNHKSGSNLFQNDCQLFLEEQLYDLDHEVIANENYSFYKKYCVQSQKICKSMFHFDLVVDSYMEGSEVARIIPAKSIEDCLAYCLDEKTFTCRSASYNRTGRSCMLSTQNRSSKPGYVRLNNNPNWRVDYFENNCYNDSFSFTHKCQPTGIEVAVESKKPYTGVLYGLYDYFTCRLEPKRQTKFSYFFPMPSVSANCTDSMTHQDSEIVLDVVLSTDGIEPLYFLTDQDVLYQARCSTPQVPKATTISATVNFDQGSGDYQFYTKPTSTATTTPLATEHSTIAKTTAQSSSTIPTTSILLSTLSRTSSHSTSPSHTTQKPTTSTSTTITTFYVPLTTTTQSVSVTSTTTPKIPTTLSLEMFTTRDSTPDPLTSTTPSVETHPTTSLRTTSSPTTRTQTTTTNGVSIVVTADTISTGSTLQQTESTPSTSKSTVLPTTLKKTTTTTSTTPRTTRLTTSGSTTTTTSTTPQTTRLTTSKSTSPMPTTASTTKRVLPTITVVLQSEKPQGPPKKSPQPLPVIDGVTQNANKHDDRTQPALSKTSSTTTKILKPSTSTSTTTASTTTTHSQPIDIITDTGTPWWRRTTNDHQKHWSSSTTTPTTTTTTTTTIAPITRPTTLQTTLSPYWWRSSRKPVPTTTATTTVATTTTPTTTTTQSTTTTSTPPPVTTSTSTTAETTTTTTAKLTSPTPTVPPVTTTTAKPEDVTFNILYNRVPATAVLIQSLITLNFVPGPNYKATQLSLVNCSVEPIQSKYVFEPLPLIINGCPADRVGLVYPVRITQGGLVVEMESFRYTDSAEIMYKCTIRLCTSNCAPLTCKDAERNTYLSYGRKKRQISFSGARPATNGPIRSLQPVNPVNYQFPLPPGFDINRFNRLSQVGQGPVDPNQLFAQLSNQFAPQLNNNQWAVNSQPQFIEKTLKKRLVVLNNQFELQYYLRTGLIPNKQVLGQFGG